ncbi:MAG: hypothetical protein U5K75_10400 [Ahrensia sp.]|nr:hypothetical protein [Ahrensia sp.]
MKYLFWHRVAKRKFRAKSTVKNELDLIGQFPLMSMAASGSDH